MGIAFSGKFYPDESTDEMAGNFLFLREGYMQRLVLSFFLLFFWCVWSSSMAADDKGSSVSSSVSKSGQISTGPARVVSQSETQKNVSDSTPVLESSRVPAAGSPRTKLPRSGVKPDISTKAPQGILQQKLQMPDVVLENAELTVGPACNYSWRAPVRNTTDHVINNLQLEIYTAIGSTWNLARTGNVFSLDPGQTMPWEVSFIRNGNKTRVFLKHNGQVLATKYADFPTHDVQIPGIYLTDIDGIIRCTTSVENKGSIPVCTGKLVAAKQLSGGGWTAAAPAYELSSGLAPGQTRNVNFDLDTTDGVAFRLDFTAKYEDTHPTWHYLDKAPFSISQNTVNNFYDNIDMTATLDQAPGWHIATVTVTNNNIIPVDGITIRGASQVSGPWYGECAVYNPGFEDLAPGEAKTRTMTWGRAIDSEKFKAYLELDGQTRNSIEFNLDPVDPQLGEVTAVRTSPIEVRWTAPVVNPALAGIGNIQMIVRRRHGSNSSWIEETVTNNNFAVASNGSATRTGTFNASIPGVVKVIIQGPKSPYGWKNLDEKSAQFPGADN